MTFILYLETCTSSFHPCPPYPISGYLSQEMKILIQKDVCIPMFFVALYKISKASKPNVLKWIKRIWYVYKHTATQNGILILKKKNNFAICNNMNGP